MAKGEDLLTVRIPFIGNPNNRDTVSSKDQRFVNAYFDVLETSDGGREYHLVKRPGATRSIQPSAGAGVGRGIYVWRGDRYAVVGNKLYKNTTDLGVTLTTSTGMCGFAETRPGAATEYLGINDGARLYLIATGGTVTTVTVNFPNPNSTDLIYFDTYFFTLDSEGKIYQCNADDPTTWDASKVITAQMYNGSGVGLAHQNNMIFCFTDRQVQGFYNAANVSGSVLTNVEQVAQQIGCASQSSITHDSNEILWVANYNSGGYCVMRMSGASGPQKISTPGIDRILRGEGSAISSCVGNWFEIAGHSFYVLRLATANRSLVYDMDNNFWLEWQEAGSTNSFPFVSFAQYQGTLIAQHATDGYIYTLSEATYQDNSVSFTVLGRFKRLDMDDNRRKFVERVRLVGDKQSTTTNVSLQYSDDDYTTLSTARTFDMSAINPFRSNFGNFRSRAWQISYAGANPLRLQGLELTMRLGLQ